MKWPRRTLRVRIYKTMCSRCPDARIRTRTYAESLSLHNETVTGGEYKKKKRKTDVSSTIISPRKKKIGSDDIITWQWNIPGIGTAKDTQRNKKKEEGCCRWASFAASGLVHCACLALTIITFIPLLYLFLAPTVSSFSPFLFRSPSSCLPWCEHDIKKHSGTSGLLWRCDLKREEGKAQAESQCSSVVFRSYDSSNSGHVYIFILGKTLSLISFFLFFFCPCLFSWVCQLYYPLSNRRWNEEIFPFPLFSLLFWRLSFCCTVRIT